ncbi:TraX family protein [Tissierella sp. Yu-01]|uniref:TraX family protein n=1 Tax=Tissierella sp. Yu-01 TaxID=3035694 RepID=UPI00240D18D1|nr:TraX family protein [Tissierella sp. Yu-01]WFA08964.1 TraX family protein [Tissierella sp. Yu-01]
MSVFALKIIALLTMMVDHYGAIFHKGVDIYRIIGRIAFPIYCFLLVEGYFHTKDIKKYAKRLFIFALISEIAFDLAFYGEIGLTHQNIFFTLLIGLGTMYVLDNPEKYRIKEGYVYSLAGITAIILGVDYSFIGIIYILAFHYTRNHPNAIRLTRVALILFITNLLTLSFNQHFALLALPFLYFYNGELGPKNKVLQYLFYIAYPLHLIVYYLIKVS